MTPILSVFIFSLGKGLFTTYLAVRLGYENTSPFFIGAISSCFFAGLSIGSFQIEKYILRVGHIRAFAAFSSIITLTILLQSLLYTHAIWLIVRIIAGFATAGIFVVIESWLLSLGSAKLRGEILAVYMISLYAGQTLGQLLLNVADIKTLAFFIIAAMLSSLSIIPILLTKTPAPEIQAPSTLHLNKLIKISISSLISTFCSGLAIGAIYGLLPLVILEKTKSATDVSMLMAIVVLGGMITQYPVGRLSDLIDRRKVLLTLAILMLFTSFMLLYNSYHRYLQCIVYFILGGMVFTIYPVTISFACDNLSKNNIISGTQSFILTNSIGAAIGPLIAPLFMIQFGVNGFFIFLIMVGAILSFTLLFRMLKASPVPREHKFVPMPHTTAVTAELKLRKNVQ